MSQKSDKKRAVSPTRQENYPEWFQECVKISQLAEPSMVRGCMIFKPHGCALWEEIKGQLDRRFKQLGVKNVYMPLFIPVKEMQKEAEHIEGFAKECAVVTHHRLILDAKGELVPDPEARMEEPLIVRPTSELLFGDAMSRWTHSYRDLPLLLNQWANVVRWEMRTRPFLRTAEFLWQEGHTAHATQEEANAFAQKMLHEYARFARETLAISVVEGQKPESEKFPGAAVTYTIEAMMQDGKALQGGTSHDLGQNFAKASMIRFTDQEGVQKFAHTTSWGVTTRLIGALMMVHGDDDGAVLPPRISPVQVGIVPFLMKDADPAVVLGFIDRLKLALEAKNYHGQPIRVEVDLSDERSSEKAWRFKKMGICHLVQVGMKEAEAGTITLTERDIMDTSKETLEVGAYIEQVVDRLDVMQNRLLEKSRHFRESHTHVAKTKAEAYHLLETKPGFVECFMAEDAEVEKELKEKYSVTIRCMPMKSLHEAGSCIFTGKPGKKALIAKAY
ncbi:MAG: proline--tRNA ligase [Chlamydiia bacterium]